MSARLSLEEVARSCIGLEREVPILSGARRRYVNFDNAATTPALGAVRDSVNRFLEVYSSIHRGTGFKSLLSTEVYEHCRKVVSRFAGADPDRDVVIFGKNTTEMVNKLTRRLALPRDAVVALSDMEHHSNDLPWRKIATVLRVPVDHRGAMSLTALEEIFERHGGRLKLLAVSGASNVTGYMPDVHALAKLAHAHGARIFVDCAQLAPHRPIDMKPHGDPGHLDFIAFSAHKMYAPYGVGALVGSRVAFEEGDPDHVGGGTVDVVTSKAAYWAPPPDKDEPGTPNTVGAVALAKAVEVLSAVGFDAITRHEQELSSRALHLLSRIDGVAVYGDTDPSLGEDRVGVIPFNVGRLHHSLASAALAWEGGIGVRHGCFCAHPFIAHLLRLDAKTTARMGQRVLAGDRSQVPGLVRMSFGIYNTLAEVEEVCEQIASLAKNGARGRYSQNKVTGEYSADGLSFRMEDYFEL